MTSEPLTAPGGRRSVALRVALMALVTAAIAAFWLSGIAPSADRIRAWGDDLGPAAPVLWPLLFALLNFVVPWPIIAGATGLLFGTAAGTALALAGVLVAATFQLGLARHLAGDALRERVLARASRLDALLERNGFVAVFYSRIVPGISWAIVNYATGLARVRLREVLAATVAGGTPKVFAYVALGGSFDDLSRPEALVAIGMLVALGVAGAIIARRQLTAR